MSDRHSELSIEAKLVGIEDLPKKIGEGTKAVEKLGNASGDAAADLNKAATATETLVAAEGQAAQASTETAGALGAVGAAAQESSQIAAEGASRAAGALDGVTAAAGEERAALLAAGEAGQLAGTEARAAIDAEAASLEEAAAAALKLGRATEQAASDADDFREGVAQVEAMAQALRDSGNALEIQRVGLRAIVSEIEKVVSAQVQRGAAGKDNANVASQALVGLRAKLADVNGEIKKEVQSFRELGTEGVSDLTEIKTSATSVSAALNAAAAQSNASWEQLNTEFFITPRALNKVSQTVEAAGIAIVEAGERGIAVTVEQLAMYERLRQEQVKLTNTANQLTNAAKDNAVRLKETGAQITGLTSGIAQLGSILGPTGAKIGFLIGNVGQLGSVYENLKDSTKGLGLNTLSAGSSLAKLGLQAGGIAAVFAIAAAAGVALSRANDQNAESTHKLWKETKNLGAGTWDAIKDGLSGIQASFREVAIAGGEYVNSLQDTGAESSNTARASRDLDVATAGLAVSMRSGESARVLFNIALRDGLTIEQASRLAVYDNGQAMQFYEQSVRGGEEGRKIWTRGLEESGGSIGALTAFIKENAAEMNNAIKTNERLTKARQEDTLAVLALRQVLDQLDTAGPNLGKNVAGMIAFADSIDETAGKVKGLTEDERERLKLIADLLRRGKDLTDAQKQQIATLLGMARAGKDASGSLNTLIRLQLSLEQASDGTTERLRDAFTVLRTLSGAWDLNSQAMRKAITDSQAALDSVDRLEAAQRRQHQTVIDGFKAMDAARSQSAALESARNITLATAEDELTRRGAAATAAIRQRLTDLAQLIPMSATYGGVLRDLGSQLQAVVDGTVTLSAEDRGRLQVIIELVARGKELTASDQAFAVSLINSALAADKATLAGNALAKIHAQLDHAVNGTTQKIETQLAVIAELTKDWELNEQAIKIAIAAYDALLVGTDHLTAAQVKLKGEIVEYGKAVTELTKTQSGLKTSQAELLDIIAGGTREQAQAAYEAYAANQKEIFSIQGKIEAGKAHVEALATNLQAVRQVITSTSQVVQTGEHEWTNIGTAQQNAATSAAAAGAATTSAATQVGQAGKSIGDAGDDVARLGTASASTAGNVRSVGKAAMDTASELSASSAEWTAETARIASARAQYEGLLTVLSSLHTTMRGVTEEAGRMGPALEKAGASAEKAAGGSITYNNVTEGP